MESPAGAGEGGDVMGLAYTNEDLKRRIAYLEAELLKVHAEHDATVADAERYRWLRDVGDGETWIAFCKRNASLSTQAIDAAIDASRLGCEIAS